MKRINRKQAIALLITACLLVSVISAYFTDADIATNTFTIGEVSLDLKEPNWDPDAADGIVQNQTVKKDPQVKNDGINDEFIFVTVEIPYAKDIITVNPDGTSNEAADSELFTYEINDGWVEIGTPVVNEETGTVTHTYAYGTETELDPLEPGTTTPTLFDEVTFINAAEKQDLEKITKDIVINAYGIQTDNINGGKTDPESVWEVIMNQISVNYVIDFGSPFSFPLSDLLAQNVDTVANVIIKSKPAYGTLTYDAENQTFTYTPTQILRGKETIAVVVQFANGESCTTYVGIIPATTVYYEESFLTYDERWVRTENPVSYQSTSKLGSGTANFGYDRSYISDITGSNSSEVSTNINSAKTTFTFTGTGYELCANCSTETGILTLARKGTTNKMWIMDTGLNYGLDGYEELMPGTDTNPTGTFYNIPVITERDLPYGEYTITVTKTNSDGQELKIDGIRIFGTMEDSAIYATDRESEPVFYELRDMVLTSLGIKNARSPQLFAALPENTSAIISHDQLDYADSEKAQKILEHTPKNEVYLHPSQTLTFKVETSGPMQIGLKAPNGATTYDLSCNNGGATITNASMESCVDMFYNLDNPTGETKTFTVSVKNTGGKILAVTLLKVCSDEEFAFASLDEADIESILNNTNNID